LVQFLPEDQLGAGLLCIVNDIRYLLGFPSHILSHIQPMYPWSSHVWLYSNFKQHCTTKARLHGHPTYAASVDLHTAFDSVSQSQLWLQLTRLRITDKIVSLIRALCRNSVSCISASQSESAWFTIESGVRQGCSDGGRCLKQGKGTGKTRLTGGLSRAPYAQVWRGIWGSVLTPRNFFLIGGDAISRWLEGLFLVDILTPPHPISVPVSTITHS